MTKLASGYFKRFPGDFAYAFWGMDKLYTAIPWRTFVVSGDKVIFGSELGEDRFWLKKN